MTSLSHPSEFNKSDHLSYLRQCITLAQQSPPKPTNFRVGCVIVSYPTSTSTTSSGSEHHRVISTGYTLELPGNTHAEQCALTKLALSTSVAEEDIHTILTPEANVVLYTSLEPCGKRLSGNLPCVQRIIATRQRGEEGSGIVKVVFGAKEPGTFVQDSQSCRLLTEAGIDWEYIPDLEPEILKVAMEGHRKNEALVNEGDVENKPGSQPNTTKSGTNVDNTSEADKREQEAMPRNRKKRMMEAPPQSDG